MIYKISINLKLKFKMLSHTIKWSILIEKKNHNFILLRKNKNLNKRKYFFRYDFFFYLNYIFTINMLNKTNLNRNVTESILYNLFFCKSIIFPAEPLSNFNYSETMREK